MVKHFAWFFILVIVSCGKSIKEDDEKRPVMEEISIDGSYFALLSPINPKISSSIKGEGRVSKFADEFKVSVRVSSAPSGTFSQGLYTGSTCPKVEHDQNADGLIDYKEARKAVGNLLVPLDGDLSSLDEGANLILKGNYHYLRSTSYYLMLADLHLAKLEEKELPLERKVIVIYRNDETKTPIACGVLTRVSYRNDAVDEMGTYEQPRNPRRVRRTTPSTQPDNSGSSSEVNEEPGSGRWSRWRERLERWRERAGDLWRRDD